MKVNDLWVIYQQWKALHNRLMMMLLSFYYQQDGVTLSDCHCQAIMTTHSNLFC